MDAQTRLRIYTTMKMEIFKQSYEDLLIVNTVLRETLAKVEHKPKPQHDLLLKHPVKYLQAKAGVKKIKGVENLKLMKKLVESEIQRRRKNGIV